MKMKITMEIFNTHQNFEEPKNGLIPERERGGGRERGLFLLARFRNKSGIRP